MPSSATGVASTPSYARILLITIGSTLFPSLTDLALSPPFLDHLIKLGVEQLVVQYGKADLTFPPGAGASSSSRDGSAEFTWSDSKSQKGTGEKGMRVKVLRYTDDFEGLIRSAKWVISHAGSGSILTVLRTPCPLLVVPNTDLMDNHQAQLADALGGSHGEDEGYLLVSTVEDLIDNVPRLLDEAHAPKRFPPVDHSRFRSILDETAGYAP